MDVTGAIYCDRQNALSFKHLEIKQTKYFFYCRQKQNQMTVSVQRVWIWPSSTQLHVAAVVHKDSPTDHVRRSRTGATPSCRCGTETLSEGQ